jgi:uncharacterized repeat protein (TIGR02543 family)
VAFPTNGTTEVVYVYAPVYTVAFNSNGGSAVPDQIITQDSANVATNGRSATKPTNPIRTGYTLEGWYLESSLTGAKYDFNTPVVGDITLYAKWQANSYQISYFANAIDATGTMPNTAVVYKSNAQLSPNIFVREAYDWVGWNTAADGGGEAYEDEYQFEPYQIAGNLSVYAQWQIKSYTVTFVDPDGNILKVETVNHGDGATAPATPHRDNQTFKNWDKAFDNITGDLTVMAVYEQNPPVILGIPDTGLLRTGTIAVVVALPLALLALLAISSRSYKKIKVKQPIDEQIFRL